MYEIDPNYVTDVPLPLHELTALQRLALGGLVWRAAAEAGLQRSLRARPLLQDLNLGEMAVYPADTVSAGVVESLPAALTLLQVLSICECYVNTAGLNGLRVALQHLTALEGLEVLTNRMEAAAADALASSLAPLRAGGRLRSVRVDDAAFTPKLRQLARECARRRP